MSLQVEKPRVTLLREFVLRDAPIVERVRYDRTIRIAPWSLEIRVQLEPSQEVTVTLTGGYVKADGWF